MRKKQDRLNIVDEKGNVIGEEFREKIHQNGLLHREAYVWFYTPTGEVILQHRGKDKDTYPDLLDATVGGHNEIGEYALATAIREAREETGLKLGEDDLQFMGDIFQRSEDSVTGTINNALKAEFIYLFNGDVAELNVEKEMALGFELWTVDSILEADEETKKKFIPTIFEPEILNILREI
ncbi:NUDIX domain-containing protein [Patescibacteria group bacterium]